MSDCKAVIIRVICGIYLIVLSTRTCVLKLVIVLAIRECMLEPKPGIKKRDHRRIRYQRVFAPKIVLLAHDKIRFYIAVAGCKVGPFKVGRESCIATQPRWYIEPPFIISIF